MRRNSDDAMDSIDNEASPTGQARLNEKLSRAYLGSIVPISEEFFHEVWVLREFLDRHRRRFGIIPADDP